MKNQIRRKPVNNSNTNHLSDHKVNRIFVYGLATFWSLVGASYIFCITFLTIPPENVRFADLSAGFVLGQIIATVVNFFMGSSSGSVMKTEMLVKNNSSDQNTNANTPTQQ